ncbi:MAG: hypothetical protein IBX63_00375 [Coriobacteriia bacterium]|nr:hypothetical protein [Coriobacteriia bacterium]
MPQAGWCEGCKAYVWVAENRGCVNGHDAAMISGIYEAEPDRGVLEEALESAQRAAERAGEATKQAWDEAKPSLKEAGAAAEKAAEEFAEGLKRFGEAIAGRTPRASDPAPPSPGIPGVSAGDEEQ